MRKIKTIIVDDEPRIRKGIERMVRSCGEDWDIVGTFSDGMEAFEAVINQSLTFDLLLTDIQMPEMDGLALNQELKNHCSFLTVFISGYDDFVYLQTALKDGAVNYILKPIDKEQFQIQLNEVKQKVITEDRKKQEWVKVQEKAAKLDYSKQIQILSEMVWNEEKDISYLDWTRQFPSGSFQLLNLSIDNIFSKTKGISSEEWNTWLFAIENILEELLHSRYDEKDANKWWWRGGKLTYWVLLQVDIKDGSILLPNHIETFSQELRFSIQKYTPFTISMAIGKEFSDLSVLGHMKHQLQALLQLRMIQGGNQIFDSSMMNILNDQKSQGIPASILKFTEQIVNSLEQGKKEELIHSLQGYYSELEELHSPVYMNEAVHYLIIRIVNKWMENNGYSEDPDLLSEALNLTKNAANFVQLKDSLKLWILKVMSKLTMLKHVYQNPIQVAKEWIKNNLHENITLKNIAQQVYMNPNYFCDYFKAQTGETVFDFVTAARLEKAKDLLVKTDLKIYDISLLIGYQDTKYFSRLFKQWIGETPSKFREHH